MSYLWFDLGEEFKKLTEVEELPEPQEEIKLYYFDKVDDEVQFVYLENLQTTENS